MRTFIWISCCESLADAIRRLPDFCPAWVRQVGLRGRQGQRMSSNTRHQNFPAAFRIGATISYKCCPTARGPLSEDPMYLPAGSCRQAGSRHFFGMVLRARAGGKAPPGRAPDLGTDDTATRDN